MSPDFAACWSFRLNAGTAACTVVGVVTRRKLTRGRVSAFFRASVRRIFEDRDDPMDTAESRPRRVTRDELYRLVWQKPMSRLAEEFGVTGNGLAKACDRLNVPCPPRGHWAKKAAGKPVVMFKLPPRQDGVLEATHIHPTPAKPTPLPQAEHSASEAAKRVADVVVPDGLERLHPPRSGWNCRGQTSSAAQGDRRQALGALSGVFGQLG